MINFKIDPYILNFLQYNPIFWKFASQPLNFFFQFNLCNIKVTNLPLINKIHDNFKNKEKKNSNLKFVWYRLQKKFNNLKYYRWKIKGSKVSFFKKYVTKGVKLKQNEMRGGSNAIFQNRIGNFYKKNKKNSQNTISKLTLYMKTKLYLYLY